MLTQEQAISLLENQTWSLSAYGIGNVQWNISKYGPDIDFYLDDYPVGSFSFARKTSKWKFWEWLDPDPIDNKHPLLLAFNKALERTTEEKNKSRAEYVDKLLKAYTKEHGVM